MSVALVYGQSSRLLPWACERIGLRSFRDDARTIGLERRGEIVAVVVFDGFSEGDCCMSVASDGSAHWLNRGFLAAVFSYPFGQLSQRRVTSLIEAGNVKSLRFCQHLGFKHEGTLRDGAPGGDLLVMGLLRSEASKYLLQEQ